MKRFFNLPTCAALAFIAIAMISAVLSPTINWLAFIWMVMTAFSVVVARLNQLTSEGWKHMYDGTVDDLAALRGDYQALDNEYLKLAKRNEATAKENAQHQVRVVDLSKQYNDAVAKYEAAVQELETVTKTLNELTKVPSSEEAKRGHTEQDQDKNGDGTVPVHKNKTKKPRPVKDEG